MTVRVAVRQAYATALLESSRRGGHFGYWHACTPRSRHAVAPQNRALKSLPKIGHTEVAPQNRALKSFVRITSNPSSPVKSGPMPAAMLLTGCNYVGVMLYAVTGAIAAADAGAAPLYRHASAVCHGSVGKLVRRRPLWSTGTPVSNRAMGVPSAMPIPSRVGTDAGGGAADGLQLRWRHAVCRHWSHRRRRCGCRPLVMPLHSTPISASPTACLLRGYRRGGAHIDGLG